MVDKDVPDQRSRRDVLNYSALVAGAGAAGLLALRPAMADAQTNGSAPVPLKVGLIDIGVIFKGYLRKDDLEKQINSKKEALEAQLKAQGAQIEALRKQIDLMKEGSQIWRDTRKNIKLEAKKFEVMRESVDEELKLEVENLTLQILDEIEDRVREFGKKNSYDLIIKFDTKGWGDERFQERIFRAQVSSVLYHDPKLDVTNTVLAMLNDKDWIKYCQDQQGKPPK